MSVQRAKVFGMDVGLDPKWIVAGLIVVAALVYYFTSSPSSDSPSSGPASVSNLPPVARPAQNPALAARAAAQRRNTADRDTLKLVPVDGSRGDVDPTLRLSLLDRLKNVPEASGLRNLFDSGAPVVAQNLPPVPKNPPNLQPKPMGPVIPTILPPPTSAPFTIPLKYYGFARAKGRSVDGSRGLFLDGDNILIGAEGDVLERHFLIVALTPTSARLEDTIAKQRQDLPVTPEAQASQ